MSKPIITKQMLIDAKACSDQVDLFEEIFGDSVVVTIKRAEEVAALFRWGWATRLLGRKGRAEYLRAEAAAWAEYKRVKAAACAELEHVKAPARAEYDRAKAAAWATAFIAMHKREATA